MGYIQGEGRNQGTLFPVILDDFVPADHVCRVIDAFVEKLAMRTIPLSQRNALHSSVSISRRRRPASGFSVQKAPYPEAARFLPALGQSAGLFKTSLAKLHQFSSYQTSACRITSFSSEPMKCRKSRSGLSHKRTSQTYKFLRSARRATRSDGDRDQCFA